MKMEMSYGDCSQLSQAENACSYVDTTQLTPAQRVMEDNGDYGYDDLSQTCAKQLYVSMHERVDVTPHNVERLYDDICYESPPEDSNWPLIDQMQNLYRRYTKSDFISQIVKDTGSRDDRLEEIRGTLFSSCSKMEGYPYPMDIELKKRKKTRKGEKVSHKLTSDIYSIVSVIENRSFDELKDVLSLPKSFTFNDLNVTINESQLNVCMHEIKSLQSQVVKCQADIVSLKQEKCSLQEELKNVKSDVYKAKSETMGHINNIKKDIERIEDEKSSGLASVRNTTKIISDDVKQSVEYTECSLKTVHEKISTLTKRIDRQFGKLDNRINDLCKQSQNDSLSKHNSVLSHTVVNVESDQPTNSSMDTPRSEQHRSYRDVVAMEKDNCEILSSGKDKPEDCTPVDTRQRVNRPLRRSSREEREHNVPATRYNRAGDHRPASTRADHSYGSSSQSEGGEVSKQPSRCIPVIVSTERSSSNVYSRSEKQNTYRTMNEQHSSVNKDTSYNYKLYGDEEAVTSGDGNCDEDEDFTESVIKKTKRFYIGGFKSSVNLQKLHTYVKNRGLKVTMIRVFQQKKSRSVVIRLNVEAPNSNKLTETGFWPNGVTCRPWLSKGQYMKTFHSREDNENKQLEDTDLSGDVYSKHRDNKSSYSYHDNNRKRYNPRYAKHNNDKHHHHNHYGEYHDEYDDHGGSYNKHSREYDNYEHRNYASNTHRDSYYGYSNQQPAE